MYKNKERSYSEGNFIFIRVQSNEPAPNHPHPSFFLSREVEWSVITVG